MKAIALLLMLMQEVEQSRLHEQVKRGHHLMMTLTLTGLLMDMLLLAHLCCSIRRTRLSL